VNNAVLTKFQPQIDHHVLLHQLALVVTKSLEILLTATNADNAHSDKSQMLQEEHAELDQHAHAPKSIHKMDSNA
jgi:hypothetical protein